EGARRTGNGKLEAGNWKQGPGARETGSWKLETGNGKRETRLDSDRLPGAVRMSPRIRAACKAELRGIAIVQPGLGGVRVPPFLPEALAVLGEEFDPPDPLRALPRIELRRDH